MQSNRRKQPRDDLNLIVEIRSPAGIENYHLGMIIDISAEGFTLESQNYNIKSGQILEIDIKLPDSNLSVSAIGKVDWVKVTKFECHAGIKFMRLDEETKKRIGQLCISAIPPPANDMSHDHAPDSNSSKKDGAVSRAVSTSTHINDPVNDDPSSPEDSHNADNAQPVPADENITQPGAITETKENMPVNYARGEISRKEPPRISKPSVTRRSAANVSARKKRSHVPLVVISIVTLIVIASVLGTMKWKSKAPAPDSFQISFNETNPAIIHKEPSQIETVRIQHIEEAEEIANDISGKEQSIISALTDLDNELNDTGFYQESVPINDFGIPSPEPEQDETLTKKNEAPPESAAASTPKTDSVEKDALTVKNNVAERLKIKSIPENDTPGEIIIPLTTRKRASLKNIRQNIMQKYKQTQKPPSVTQRDAEKALSQINNDQGQPPVNVRETHASVTDSTVIDKADRSYILAGSRDNIMSGTEPGLREPNISSAAAENKKSVSEPVSSSPAPSVAEIIQDIADKKTPLPAAKENQFPAPDSITSRVFPQKFEDNKTRELISSSTAGMTKSYDEPFDNNTNDWDIFNTGSASAEILDGAYIIENKRQEGAHLLLHHNEFPAASDFSIETSIRLLEKSASASFGLVFGAIDSFNNYSFQITTNRLYMVRKFHQGISREMTIGEKQAANFNISVLNKLKIVRSGDTMSFYINDKLVDTITDLHLYGKRVGFIIDGPSKIAVEHMHSEIQIANSLR